MIAGPPDGELATPAAVLDRARGCPVRAVWRNLLGGLTFEINRGVRREFMKWAPATSRIDFQPEAERLVWAGRFILVPRVISLGSDDEGRWMVTSELVGENAVAERWRARPEIAVRAHGEGLRRIHDSVPVESCPFSWSVATRLDRIRAGQVDERHLNAESFPGVFDDLANPPPIDRLVVCHGDACAPNTILSSDGSVSGYVDLGNLGIADRWADLAVAAWSTEWNYGPGWEGLLLDSYGAEPDLERTAYYRLLWDVAI